MTTKQAVYRPPFLPVLFAVFVVATIVAAATTWDMAFFGLPVPGVLSFTFLKLLCIFYLCSMPMAFAVVYSLGASVLPEGIRGKTFWGAGKTIAWANMASIDRIGVGPIRFLRLFPEHGAPLWIPLFIKRLPEFRSEARTYIGAKHPLFPFASEGP